MRALPEHSPPILRTVVLACLVRFARYGCFARYECFACFARFVLLVTVVLLVLLVSFCSFPFVVLGFSTQYMPFS